MLNPLTIKFSKLFSETLIKTIYENQQLIILPTPIKNHLKHIENSNPNKKSEQKYNLKNIHISL